MLFRSIERGGKLGVSVADEMGEPAAGSVKIRSQAAGQLDYPGSGRVVGDAEQMGPADAVLDHESHAQAFQGHCVDVKEVDREQTIGLGAQERAPRVAATGRRRDLAPTQIRRIVEAATRCPSRRNSPWIRTTPRSGLLRQPRDQRGDLVTDRRPTRRLRLTPPCGNQAAMPLQQRGGSDDAADTQRFRQEPAQRRERRPVGPR